MSKCVRLSVYKKEMVVEMIGNEEIEDIVNDARLAPRYWDIHGSSKPLHMDMGVVQW